MYTIIFDFVPYTSPMTLTVFILSLGFWSAVNLRGVKLSQAPFDCVLGTGSTEGQQPPSKKNRLSHTVTSFYAESRWAPDEIVPFDRRALPRVLDRWPVLRDLSSCDSAATDPPLPAAVSSDHVEEAYEHRDDLWDETEELEMELGVHDYVEIE